MGNQNFLLLSPCTSANDVKRTLSVDPGVSNKLGLAGECPDMNSTNNEDGLYKSGEGLRQPTILFLATVSATKSSVH